MPEPSIGPYVIFSTLRFSGKCFEQEAPSSPYYKWGTILTTIYTVYTHYGSLVYVP